MTIRKHVAQVYVAFWRVFGGGHCVGKGIFSEGKCFSHWRRGSRDLRLQLVRVQGRCLLSHLSWDPPGAW